MQQKTTATILAEFAREANVTVSQPALGHFQLRGKLLVNYWPDSKKKRAHVDGTVSSKTNVTPREAVIMTFTKPERVRKGEKKDFRDDNYVSDRKNLLQKSNKCHWCGQILIFRTSTLDHRVPLNRGGLDNACNFVLACMDCNALRGDDMPEIDGHVFRNLADDPDWLHCRVGELTLQLETVQDQLANVERVIHGATWRGDEPSKMHCELESTLKGHLRACQSKIDHYLYLLRRLETFAGRFVEVARKRLPPETFTLLEHQAKGSAP